MSRARERVRGVCLILKGNAVVLHAWGVPRVKDGEVDDATI